MTAFFWTTTENRGEQFVIAEGGHYEALERKGDSTPKRASVKRSGTLIPSSDVPELCVSASAAASLFAKLQGASTTGTYYVYRTEERPDTDVTSAGLDFAELEEYRYTMRGERTVEFTRYTTVAIPQEAVDDVERAYETAGQHQTNTRLATAVKQALGSLVEQGAYNREPVEEAVAERFEDFADSYGIEQAKRLFNGIPDAVDDSKY